MTIQPNAAVAGIAGTARAQQRGSDSETVKNQQAAVDQRDAPGQVEGADQLTLEASSKLGDRDADGRLPQERSSYERSSYERPSDEESPESPSAKAVDEDCGEHLDLQA